MSMIYFLSFGLFLLFLLSLMYLYNRNVFENKQNDFNKSLQALDAEVAKLEEAIKNSRN